MKIEKINPHGYCGGVIRALNLSYKALDNNKNNIYMIGKVIHNDIVCDDLERRGIVIKTNNKMEAVSEINEGTVIFTAHGISEDVFNLAKSKNLNIIDTTCTKVQVILNSIKKHLSTHTILYIGVKNHPECDAVLSLSKDIILINSVEDLVSLPRHNKYYITNQTTLSLLKIKAIYDYIENNFKNTIIDNKICLATTQRQKAILNTTADCIIVVGDKKSSNTNELYNLSKTICTSYLISEYKELIGIDLFEYNDIKITSGASTPEFLVDELIEYLNKTYL